MTVQYEIHEQIFFGSDSDNYRQGLYNLYNLSDQLLYTLEYAAHLKVSQPEVHASRSVFGIFLHLIYLDNLFANTRQKTERKIYPKPI